MQHGANLVFDTATHDFLLLFKTFGTFEIFKCVELVYNIVTNCVLQLIAVLLTRFSVMDQKKFRDG